jgi:hypothetical protein
MGSVEKVLWEVGLHGYTTLYLVDTCLKGKIN